jgi:hypothetical protein
VGVDQGQKRAEKLEKVESVGGTEYVGSTEGKTEGGRESGKEGKGEGRREEGGTGLTSSSEDSDGASVGESSSSEDDFEGANSMGLGGRAQRGMEIDEESDGEPAAEEADAEKKASASAHAESTTCASAHALASESDAKVKACASAQAPPTRASEHVPTSEFPADKAHGMRGLRLSRCMCELIYCSLVAWQNLSN